MPVRKEAKGRSADDVGEQAYCGQVALKGLRDSEHDTLVAAVRRSAPRVIRSNRSSVERICALRSTQIRSAAATPVGPQRVSLARPRAGNRGSEEGAV